MNQSGRGFFPCPPALTHGHVEDSIPLALHDIAVAAGWIKAPAELEEEDLDSGLADLFGGTLIVEKSYKEWFVGLVADTLVELEVVAANNLEAQQRHHESMMEYLTLLGRSRSNQPQGNGADNPAGKLIDEFFAKSETIHDLQDLVDAASIKKPVGDVGRSSVSRIYNGFGAGPETRQFVASVINEVVPCHKDDLEGTKRS